MAINPNTTFSSGAILTAAQMNRLPWGITAYAAKTANQNGISSGTITDVTSLSVTWTADSSRYYRTTVFIPFVLQNTSGAVMDLFITDGSNVQKQQASQSISASNYDWINVVILESGLSGSTTRKARVKTSAGTIDINAGAAYPCQIWVEDLGPA